MNLPVDLIIEILYFLPVKSLFRFEYVCKTWESLIKKQIFIRKQSQKEGSTISLLLRNRESDLPCFCAHSHELYGDGDDDVHFIGLCNGLVCVSICSGSDMKIILWNPSTRESRLLPPPSVLHASLFNPTLGFGFDSNSNDHKVVKFRQTLKDKSIFLVEIYSMATNSWMKYLYADYLGMVQDSGDEYIIDTSGWVGVVCWLAKGLVGEEAILSFDMSTDRFWNTLLPLDAFQSAQQSSQILPFRNSLALVAGRNNLDESIFHIWTIDDLNVEGSWTKMTIIGPILGNYGSLAFWRNCEFLILEDFRCMELISCDLGSHKTRKMGINKTRFSFDTVLEYIETSVSVDMPSLYGRKGLLFSQIWHALSLKRHVFEVFEGLHLPGSLSNLDMTMDGCVML